MLLAHGWMVVPQGKVAFRVPHALKAIHAQEDKAAA